MPFDDDAEADHTSFRPPPHPDDRLWRHPSEMSCHPIVPVGAPGEQSFPDPSLTTEGGVARRRPWGAFVAAGTLGAVVAGGGVIVLGIGERVVERPVTEHVALNPTVSAIGTPESGTLDSLQQRVSPAVVAIGAAGAVAGSGVVVRDDGIAITSASLVDATGGDGPTVVLPDGSEVATEVVGSDPVTGLALIDMAGEGHTPSVMATDAGLAAGATAFALSAAPARAASTARGIVGPAQRYLGPDGTALDGIEIEGEAVPASLGGPLVDERGAVVGIVTAVEDGSTWYVAPVEVVRRVAGDLLADGVVHHAWLGIEGTEAGSPLDSATGTYAAGPDDGAPDDGAPDDAALGDSGPGVTEPAGDAAPGDGGAGAGTLVASVVEGSPAGLGGLAPGDVIVALDGRPVTRMPDLTVGLRSRSPGDRVDVTVARHDGSHATLVITLAEAPPAGP